MHNAEEFVAVRLAICGELELEEVLECGPLRKVSMYRAVKSLRNARVIIKHRYADGRVFLRLSSLGTEYLRSLSPALLQNARQLVNEQLKYSGAREARMRDRANYEFYKECLDQKIEINGISCEYSPKAPFIADSDAVRSGGEPLFFDENGIKSLEEIVKTLPKGYTGLLTKKVVKRKKQTDVTNEGNRVSRISGTLMLNNQVYQAYTLIDPLSSAWKPEAEFIASNYIAGAIERECPTFRKKGIRIKNKCLILLNSPENALKLISPGAEKLRVDPTEIYEESYVLPSFRIGEAKRRLFSLPDWKKAVTLTLFPGGCTEGVADVIAEDDTEIYNLIGCDLTRLRSITPRVLGSDEKAVLLAESWMLASLHRIFCRDNIEIVEIKDEELAILAGSLSSERPAHAE